MVAHSVITTLPVGTDEIVVPATAGVAEQQIFSLFGYKDPVVDANWCRIMNKQNGLTVDTLKIGYDALPAGMESRTANIKLTDGYDTITLKVTQKADQKKYDVTDVTRLINMILGTTPANLEVADINADGILGPAACKMCGGMQNPLGVCFAQIIDRFAGKKKFTEKERSTTVSGLVLACCYIQEYVIPFLVQDTWRCIIPCMIGGAISGGLCGYFALESAAVHGGVFVIPMMSNPLQFVLFWFAGAAVNGILYFLLRKPVAAEGDMAGNGVLDQLLG